MGLPRSVSTIIHPSLLTVFHKVCLFVPATRQQHPIHTFVESSPMEDYTIPLEKAVELTPASSQPDTFTNSQPLWSFVGGYGVFGGSTVAHCLVAAQKTIPSDCVAHSLHCSFVASANPKQPIEYSVERTRDGTNFRTRTVHATQKAKVISAAIVNFVQAGTYSKSSDTDKAGRLEHEPKRPEGLTLPDHAEMDGKEIDGPFETRWGEVLNQRSDDLVNTRIRYWMRAKKSMQQTGPQVQLAALTYMSDAYFIRAAVQVHEVPDQTLETKMAMAASLNHTVYFHHPDAVRADQWMCSERESPWAGNDRALVIQRIWSPEGILVATCVQEGVLRVQAPSEKVKL
ncbi:thioesterase-like superfamily-domain-containing protein [Aspergillus unguis]